MSNRLLHREFVVWAVGDVYFKCVVVVNIEFVGCILDMLILNLSEKSMTLWPSG